MNMELQKTNDTVWSIKRKGYPGKFVLRSSEQSGKILAVAISLEENGHTVTFEMKYPEFNNFLRIISSFKDLLLATDHSVGQPSISVSKIEGKRQPIEIKKEQTFNSKLLTPSPEGERLSKIGSKQAQVDEGLANLEKIFNDDMQTLDERDEFNTVTASEQEAMARALASIQEIHESRKTSTESKNPIIPSTKGTTEKNQSDSPTEKKKILKETDWDPW